MLIPWNPENPLPVPQGVDSLRVILDRGSRDSGEKDSRTHPLLLGILGELQVRILAARGNLSEAVLIENIRAGLSITSQNNPSTRVPLVSEPRRIPIFQGAGEHGIRGDLCVRLPGQQGLAAELGFQYFPSLPVIIIKRQDLRSLTEHEPSLVYGDWETVKTAVNDATYVQAFLLERT